MKGDGVWWYTPALSTLRSADLILQQSLVYECRLSSRYRPCYLLWLQVSGDSGSTERPAISEWRGASRLPAINELRRMSAPADDRRRGSRGTNDGSDDPAQPGCAHSAGAEGVGRGGQTGADSRLQQPGNLARLGSVPMGKAGLQTASQERNGGLSGSQAGPAGGSAGSKWRSGSMDPPPPKPPRRPMLGSSSADQAVRADVLGSRFDTSGSGVSNTTRFAIQLAAGAQPTKPPVGASAKQAVRVEDQPQARSLPAPDRKDDAAPGPALGPGAAESRRERPAPSSPSESARQRMGQPAFRAVRERMQQHHDVFREQLVQLHR